jgi:NCS2 family nucleobase:cation symporter-2
MIPLVSDKFLQFFPAALSPLLGSSVLLAALAAVLLNAIYNGVGARQV